MRVMAVLNRARCLISDRGEGGGGGGAVVGEGGEGVGGRNIYCRSSIFVHNCDGKPSSFNAYFVALINVLYTNKI